MDNPAIGHESMLPTLLVGDRFFVDHDAYSDQNRPERGDIIVFTSPADVLSGRGSQYVKRVVGLPGDTVALKNGVPIINGKAAEWERLGEQTNGASGKVVRWRERLADGTSYEIQKYRAGQPLDDGGPVTVPVGAYFVLGDNRDNSIDSRSFPGRPWFFIPSEYIIGRANYVYWSGFERFGRIGTPLK